MHIIETRDVWQRLRETDKPIVFYGMGNGADKIIAVLDRIGVADILQQKLTADQRNGYEIPTEEYEIQGFPTVFVVGTDGKKTQIQNNFLFEGDVVNVVKAKALNAAAGRQ